MFEIFILHWVKIRQTREYNLKTTIFGVYSAMVVLLLSPLIWTHHNLPFQGALNDPFHARAISSDHICQLSAAITCLSLLSFVLSLLFLLQLQHSQTMKILMYTLLYSDAYDIINLGCSCIYFNVKLDASTYIYETYGINSCFVAEFKPK